MTVLCDAAVEFMQAEFEHLEVVLVLDPTEVSYAWFKLFKKLALFYSFELQITEMTEVLKLPIIDLSSPDRFSAAKSIHQACLEFGFFYVVNHGVEEELLSQVLDQSNNFFALPLQIKLNLARKHYRGYTPLFAESLDPSSPSIGDSKESYYIGPLEDELTPNKLNQWPSQEILPSWRTVMECFYRKLLTAGNRILSLMALALDLDENYFEKVGMLDQPNAFLRLLYYPGDIGTSGEEVYGASAHSDYGMITLLASNGVHGLQVCREKFKQPRVWDDILHINGAFIVNVGDMMERWTNSLYRSTMHRVMPTGQERYSVIIHLLPCGYFLLFHTTCYDDQGISTMKALSIMAQLQAEIKGSQTKLNCLK